MRMSWRGKYALSAPSGRFGGLVRSDRATPLPSRKPPTTPRYAHVEQASPKASSPQSDPSPAALGLKHASRVEQSVY